MKSMLELFSGSGILSAHFKKGGWNTMEIDILNGDDVLKWKPERRYDFVWASPPCQDYSALRYDYPSIWKADKTLWLRTLELIQSIKPRYWIIENVKMAQWLWGRAPQHYGSFFLWGYYPKLSIPKGLWSKSQKGTHLFRDKGDLRLNEDRTPEERARLPEGLCELIFKTIDKAI